MSFRELSMTDIREVLRRWSAGQAVRAIARETRVDRKTVDRYVAAGTARGFGRGSEVSDELVGEVSRAVQDRELPPPSEQWKELEKHRSRVEQWLQAETPLRLVRVHELLARDGVVVSYTTLRRFVHRELGWRERPPTIRIDDSPPGDEAQLDFGLVGRFRDADGRLRKLWVLVVTLTSSRYMFVWPTFLQTVEALCEGLDAAWRFFDGMPKRIVFDNMSAAVSKADHLSPTLQRSFLEYVQTRSLFADAARVRRPQDKGRVENQVAYVRERWFQGETFMSFDACRASAETWCRDIAGARVHGTTRRVPREVYELEEKPHMLPAPTAAFDVPEWTEAKVHPDHHIQVKRALYSVPWPHVGHRVDVRIDRTSVRVYKKTELVKIHPRQRPGGRSTDPTDYPPTKAPWALRSIAAAEQESQRHGKHVAEFVARLVDGPLPWSRMRQVYALLRLCSKFDAARVDTICCRALAFGVLDVRRVEQMLKSAQRVESSVESTGKLVVFPKGRFARDPQSFATRDSDKQGGAS
jgi:transposase